MWLSICLILIYLLKRHPHFFQSEMLSTSRLPGQPSLSEDTEIHFKVIQEEAFSDIQTVPYTHTHTHTHTLISPFSRTRYPWHILVCANSASYLFSSHPSSHYPAVHFHLYLQSKVLSSLSMATPHRTQDLNFLTRDWTQASCIGSVESRPLDHQGMCTPLVSWGQGLCWNHLYITNF